MQTSVTGSIWSLHNKFHSNLNVKAIVENHIRETNTNLNMKRADDIQPKSATGSKSLQLGADVLHWWRLFWKKKKPSDVGSKMGTVIVFLEGLLYMQFTYPTAWHESWVMARGIQQWNNFRLFQSGESRKRGYKQQMGVTLHFLSSDSHRMKHLFTTNPPQSFVLIHKTSDQNITADPNLSWVTDASDLIQTLFLGGFFYTLLKPTVRCGILSNCYN